MTNSILSDKSIIYDISQIKDGNMAFLWGEHDEVLKNRQAFFQKFNCDLKNGIMMHVTHGTDVAKVTTDNLGQGMTNQENALKVDALTTNESGIILCLPTADCLPISFYDPKNHAITLAHLGWKGTDQHFAEIIIKKMSELYNTEPKDLLVSIGPGIHVESYIFPNPVLQSSNPDWHPYLKDLPDGQTAIDNVKFNVNQLIKSGVLAKNIETMPIDTANDENYFSHYRSVRQNEPEGRFMTILGIEK